MEYSVATLLHQGVQLLQQKEILRSRLEAEILLGFVLGVERVELHRRLFENIEPFHAESYFRLLKRRANAEPLEYLIQKVSFYSQEFYISHGALIPRPETEILVEKTLDVLLQKHSKNVVEIGVGSGVISIMLALLTKGRKITFHASDISPEALFNAHVNQMRFGVDNITLHLSAYLDFNAKLGVNFDVLVANPPYIQYGQVLPKSLAYEPQQALFGGERGDEMLCHIIDLAYEHRIPYVLCEMGYNQRVSIKEHLRGIPHKNVAFYQDLAGLDRGFVLSL